MSARRQRVTVTAAVLLLLFCAAVVAEHVLQPGLSVRDHRISEYAHGRAGWLSAVGFAAWAAALGMTAGLVWSSSLRPARAAHALAAFVALGALGAAGTAAFKTGTSADVVPAGHELTLENHLHDAASGLLALALWAGILTGVTVRDRVLRTQSAVLLALAAAVALVLSGVALDLPGARQRALLALAVVWQLALLAAVRRAPLRSRPDRPPARAGMPQAAATPGAAPRADRRP